MLSVQELATAVGDPLVDGAPFAMSEWLPGPHELRAAPPVMREDVAWIGRHHERHAAALAKWTAARGEVAAVAEDYDAAMVTHGAMVAAAVAAGQEPPRLAPGLQTVRLPLEARQPLRSGPGGEIVRAQLGPARAERDARGELYAAVMAAVRMLWQKGAELERLAWELSQERSPEARTLGRRLQVLRDETRSRDDVLDLVDAFFIGAGRAAQAALRPVERAT